MSEIREIYLDKDGRLILEKDILLALHLRDSKVKCMAHVGLGVKLLEVDRQKLYTYHVVYH